MRKIRIMIVVALVSASTGASSARAGRPALLAPPGQAGPIADEFSPKGDTMVGITNILKHDVRGIAAQAEGIVSFIIRDLQLKGEEIPDILQDLYKVSQDMNRVLGDWFATGETESIASAGEAFVRLSGEALDTLCISLPERLAKLEPVRWLVGALLSYIDERPGSWRCVFNVRALTAGMGGHDLPGSAPACVCADPADIALAVWNLKSNWKDLETQTFSLRTDTDNNEVRILCYDEGMGIPRNMLPHIFTRGVSINGEGRGLGLAIARQAVERGGGTLEVVSKRAGNAYAWQAAPGPDGAYRVSRADMSDLMLDDLPARQSDHWTMFIIRLPRVHLPGEEPVPDSRRAQLAAAIEEQVFSQVTNGSAVFNVFRAADPRFPFVIKVPRADMSKHRLEDLRCSLAFARKFMGGVVAPFTVLKDVSMNGTQYPLVVVAAKRKLLQSHTTPADGAFRFYPWYHDSARGEVDAHAEERRVLMALVERGIDCGNGLSPQDMGYNPSTGQCELVDYGHPAFISSDEAFGRHEGGGPLSWLARRDHLDDLGMAGEDELYERWGARPDACTRVPDVYESALPGRSPAGVVCVPMTDPKGISAAGADSL